MKNYRTFADTPTTAPQKNVVHIAFKSLLAFVDIPTFFLAFLPHNGLYLLI
jgi:hypothetical protein